MEDRRIVFPCALIFAVMRPLSRRSRVAKRNKVGACLSKHQNDYVIVDQLQSRRWPRSLLLQPLRLPVLLLPVLLLGLAIAGCMKEQASPEVQNSSLYSRFSKIASSEGLDLNKHGSYDNSYVESRARLYCSLLLEENTPTLTREVALPPIQTFGEPAEDRPQLERAIVMAAVLESCPGQAEIGQRWLKAFGN